MINFEDTIISQYANSPTLRQLIVNLNEYLDPQSNIDDFYDLMWNVDTAQGYGLDVWGRIVGVGRVLQVPQGNYLGLIGPNGFSGKPFNIAPFYKNQSLTSNFSLLDDPYRALIFAKALSNITDASIPSINQILINLFGPTGPLPLGGNSYCTDGLNMTMTYTFTSTLDPVSSAIVFQSGILPKPCGVSVSVVHP